MIPVERWPEVERWLLAALDSPETEREDVLDGLCPEGLRPLVRRLIRGLEVPNSDEGKLLDPIWLLDAIAAAADDTSEEDRTRVHASRATAIGPYFLSRLLGRGGMGEVYLAERDSPGFPPRSALKVLRPDLVSDEALLRFRRERIMLSAVDSPHVPHLLDAGTTADGRPYYVMEYVEGEPITAYVARRNPSLAERLRLMEDVCEAVTHVHGRLIIHRDLKPSNIYVSEIEGAPCVKLLDFGVATVMLGDKEHTNGTSMRGEARSLASTVLTLTQDGKTPHTPEYAAPEQRDGAEVTTASDLYALGVLLCEIVTDQRPAPGVGFPYCDHVPVEDLLSPLQAFDTVRRMAPDGHVQCAMHGICTKAAHADPFARHSSTDEFAAALRAFRERLEV